MQCKFYLLIIVALFFGGCGNGNESSAIQPSNQNGNSEKNNQTNQKINCTDGEVLFWVYENSLVCSKGQWTSMNYINKMDLCNNGAIFFDGQSWQLCMDGFWYVSQEPFVNCPQRESSIHIFDDQIDPHKMVSQLYFTCIGKMWILNGKAISKPII